MKESEAARRRDRAGAGPEQIGFREEVVFEDASLENLFLRLADYVSGKDFEGERPDVSLDVIGETESEPGIETQYRLTFYGRMKLIEAN